MQWKVSRSEALSQRGKLLLDGALAAAFGIQELQGGDGLVFLPVTADELIALLERGVCILRGPLATRVRNTSGHASKLHLWLIVYTLRNYDASRRLDCFWGICIHYRCVWHTPLICVKYSARL